MKRYTKIVLGLVSLCIVGFAFICCGAQKFTSPEYLEEVAAFAEGAKDIECEREAFRRLDACAFYDILCLGGAQQFNKRCLPPSESTGRFCGRFEFDPDDELTGMAIQATWWTEQQCGSRVHKKPCKKVLLESAKHCMNQALKDAP